MTNAAFQQKHTWREEIRDLMRGVGGAAIIGVPLVYTMEVWQAATTLGTGEIFKLLCFGFAVCVGYNFFSGFRQGGTLVGAVRDAAEALAIGVVFGGVLMLLLGIIDHETPFTDAVCKIALESVPLAMGASVANTQFDGGDSSNRMEGSSSPDRKKRAKARNSTLQELGVAAAGSLILASSIAPTEEVMVISRHSSPFGLMMIVAFSLLLSYGMIFVADFTGADVRKESKGLLQSPFGETVLCYAVALAISLVSVRFFHGVRFADSPYSVVALTVSLGLPAAIGGAAGRLVV